MAAAQRPRWRRPSPLGYGPSIDAMGNVAAPLLAGFSVATLGIVLTAEQSLRWPGIVIICLTGAAASFVMCLQCGFHARQHLYSPADAADWWEESDLEARRDDIQAEQEHDYEVWLVWMNRTRRLYNSGIYVLWVGIGVALVPPVRESTSEATSRWAAVGVATAALLTELLWSGIPAVRRYFFRRRVLRGREQIAAGENT